jgi:hypothetical protein
MNKNKTFNLIGFKLFLLFVLISFVTLGCGKKDDTTTKTDDEKKEESKIENITEGTPIHYEMEATGQMQGTWDVYAKGKKAYVKASYKAAGQDMKSEMWMSEDAMYILSDIGGKKMGMKMDPKKFMQESEQKKDFNALTFKDGCKDCEKIGEEEVIGKKCSIYRDKNGIKYSIYKDKIPLKIVMEKTTMQAKKLEIDANLSDDMFSPPKDVEFMEMDKMMEGFKDMKDMKDMKEKMKDVEDMMKKYNK